MGGSQAREEVQVKGMGSSSVGWQWQVIFFFLTFYFLDKAFNFPESQNAYFRKRMT